MKNGIILLILTLIISSCDLIKSKENKLTEKEWYLFMEKNSLEHKTDYYTKANSPVTLKFDTKGIVSITKNKSEEIPLWQFSKNKKWINIDYKDKNERWFYELSDKELIIIVYDNNNNSVYRKYYHSDGEWKDKKWIETRNLMQNNIE